ncbi:cytochrome P450 [Nocardia sp. NPDC052001]|uniref:cytochrome P450 n=1 Tax=unclassified Nocardia TaxID=2637762 RepID=UPI0034296C54
MIGARYWVRWLVEQGAPRYGIRMQTLRDDPLADLMGSVAGLRDPFPPIERLRERGRLVPSPIAWGTADYEVSRGILRDGDWGVYGITGFERTGVVRRIADRAPIPPNPVEKPSMLISDPPEHTRLRKSVSKAFTPRAIGRLRDRVESVTTELLDALPSDGSADLIHDFAAHVPIAIISEMLGFPDESRDTFLAWGDVVSPMLDIGISWRQWRNAVVSMRGMDGYLDEHIARLRDEPREDILSALVSAGDLTDGELKSAATLLMGAGFETAVNLIGNGVVHLLSNPDQLAILRDEPELWPNAVEEMLRFEAPIQAAARLALRDTEIAGVPLKKGSLVVMSLGGANRDPAVFENPNTFDVTRSNAKDHLSFSSGVHACLGASLARMEGIHALRALFERFPDLTLTAEPSRRPLFTLRGYSSMPAHLGQRARIAS